MYLLEGDNIRQDIVYLAHPRTASVATQLTLSEMGTFHTIGSHHEIHIDQIPKDAIVFTTIRNPWDLFISWWFKKTAYRTVSLEEFIPSLVENNERYFRGGKLFSMVEYANQILCYEQLQVQFDLLLVQVGYAPKELVVTNCSENRLHKKYQCYYTDEANRWVAEHFASEIERYGYQF